MRCNYLGQIAVVAAILSGGCSMGEVQATGDRMLELGEVTSPDAPHAKACEREAGRKIRVDDPTQLALYDQEMLGIVDIHAEREFVRECMDDAIRDGAEILSKREDSFTAFYPTRFESYIDSARERIDIAAVEGRWSEAYKRVIPGVSGRILNVKETWSDFRRMLREGGDSFKLIVEEKPALSSDMGAASGFEPKVLIGEYRTEFSKAKNRTINVKLAASSLNGIFLMPGAEFSYNEWVGERSEARGFKEAPVIEQGQLVEGLGGGACQVSSTVHAAALLAGLGILERSNHSLPSSYIPVGMDAVVSYPILDLRVKNTLERPVVIKVYTEENTLIAKIYSDEPRKGKVMFRREISDELPYKEIITVDPTLEPGTIKIKKRGKVGYKVQRARMFIEDGKERYEKLLADTYQSQAQQTFIAPDVVYPPPETEEE